MNWNDAALAASSSCPTLGTCFLPMEETSIERCLAWPEAFKPSGPGFARVNDRPIFNRKNL
jgi:hypothetical protein